MTPIATPSSHAPAPGASVRAGHAAGNAAGNGLAAALAFLLPGGDTDNLPGAADGKTVPVDGKQLPGNDASADEDPSDDKTADPAFAWLGFALPPLPEITPPAGAVPGGTPGATAALPDPLALLGGKVDPAPADPTPGDAPPVAISDGGAARTTEFHDAIAQRLRLNDPASLAQPVVEPEPATAAPVKLMAELRATAAVVPADRSADTSPLPDGQLAAAPLDLRPHGVAGAGNAHQAGVDLTQDQGLHRMIDRIETLRDAADAGDTRIRLSPAGLGTVDVSVRRDGDLVHVRFSAEQADTRALIADAQPRLAELAEARGIKLGETSVDNGSTASQSQPQAQSQAQAQAEMQGRQQHARRAPDAPRSAAAPTTTPLSAGTGGAGRIA